MKPSQFLTAFLMLATRAALAQTVVPPGSVPGAQTVVTPDMRNAGSPRASRHEEKAPGMSRRDEKKLQKMAKVKPGSNGILKAKPN